MDMPQNRCVFHYTLKNQRMDHDLVPCVSLTVTGEQFTIQCCGSKRSNGHQPRRRCQFVSEKIYIIKMSFIEKRK
jgi:hypothetical protein